MSSTRGSHKFQCALVTGGGGGIGKAFAKYLVSQGTKVIIAGRTESNLRTAVSEIGASAYYVLDTGKTEDISQFVRKLIAEHPELDCVVNNAGIQNPLEVDKLGPDDFLRKADQEIDVNIRGPMHLTLQLIPHFLSKPSAAIVNVSSVLGFVPLSIINPVYNGTKAWLHSWSMNLRTQLKHSAIRVVEIAPPMVATDLHREREDPDDNKKEKDSSTMTVNEFMDEVTKKWEQGQDMITAGPGNRIVNKWHESFSNVYPG